jgi:hypothetical protein
MHSTLEIWAETKKHRRHTPAYFTPLITMKEISFDLLGFTHRRSELEIRSDIISQQVFGKLVLPAVANVKKLLQP